jgi:hypothetical protein
MADAGDLKSPGLKPCGFESRLRHQRTSILIWEGRSFKRQNFPLICCLGQYLIKELIYLWKRIIAYIHCKSRNPPIMTVANSGNSACWIERSLSVAMAVSRAYAKRPLQSMICTVAFHATSSDSYSPSNLCASLLVQMSSRAPDIMV